MWPSATAAAVGVRDVGQSDVGQRLEDGDPAGPTAEPLAVDLDGDELAMAWQVGEHLGLGAMAVEAIASALRAGKRACVDLGLDDVLPLSGFDGHHLHGRQV